MICLNCNTKLSCGCQKKTAVDGKQVCASCIQGYEAKLKVSKEQKAEVLKKYTR